MNLQQRKVLDRRTLLRGAGVSLALPWLECMSPLSKSLAQAGSMRADEIPRRAVFTMWGMGLNGRDYTPKEEGKNYQLTPILKPLQPFRDEFTVISGLKLIPSGAHNGDRSFLTGTNLRTAGAKLRISCDQELAAAVGGKTRFPSLVLGVRRGTGYGGRNDFTLSWSKFGTPLAAENRPHVLFDQIFRDPPKEVLAQFDQEQKRTGSVLDTVDRSATWLKHFLGKADGEKLDEYFTSVRMVEKQMETDRLWVSVPRPKVEEPEFGENLQALDPQLGRGFDYRRYQRLMFDVITLALQTDSTRVVSYMPRIDLADGTSTFRSEGNPYGYHEMTHHGEDSDKLKWLTQADIWYMEEWAYLINKLKSVKEGAATLFDHTVTTWSSSGGTQNAHNNTQLPAIVFGGSRLGLAHQGHMVKKDRLLGSLWETVFGAMKVATPEGFQGGATDGVMNELLSV